MIRFGKRDNNVVRIVNITVYTHWSNVWPQGMEEVFMTEEQLSDNSQSPYYWYKQYKRLFNENEQLKSRINDYDVALKTLQDLADKKLKENEQLKQTISKIDFAIIRKYDNSLENLLDEIYDGEYNNWIQKQLLRAKKLNGDVE